MKDIEPTIRPSHWPARQQLVFPAAPPTAGAVPGRHGLSLAEVCWRRRWTVTLGVFLCLAAAGVYIVKAPRIYTPTASLYVDANGLALLGTNKQTSTADAESYLLRQCELIRSELVVRQAVDANPGRLAVMYPGAIDPVGEVRNALAVAVGKKDDVITVALTSVRPVEGAALVNAIVAAYQAQQAEQSHATVSEEVRILQGEKDKQEHALDRQQQEIVAFKQSNGEMFFNTDRGTNITIQNLATISDHVTRVRLYATELRAAYDQDPTLPRRRAWEMADAQAAAVQRDYDQQKAAALKINAAMAVYQKLQSDADRTSKQCDLLDGKIRELDVNRQAGPDIRVLEPAKVELKPTSPRKSVALMTAMAAGMALGCGLALVRDQTDHRLRTALQAARLLGSPVLGVLPEVSAGGARDEPLRWARVVRQEPEGALAGAFRSLAAEVCFGRPFNGGCSRLVTSPNRGDGKSTVAANLAVAAAHAGRRTLLLDADLRKPVQHQVFDAMGTTGLVDVVTDGVPLDQAIRRTSVRGLSLLPAGVLAGNPGEVVGSIAFGETLRRLEEQFDLVVIDAPPLLGAGEARVLAAHADAALLVLRAKRTTRAAARIACDRVLGVGCSLLGLAFNGSGQADADADVHAGPADGQVWQRTSNLGPATASAQGGLEQRDWDDRPARSVARRSLAVEPTGPAVAVAAAQLTSTPAAIVDRVEGRLSGNDRSDL
jgi:tyrosine-protein kinase Etk/Wzc